MFDEIHDRAYRAGREQLHAGIDKGLETLGRRMEASFRALRGIRLAAPRTSRSTDARCA